MSLSSSGVELRATKDLPFLKYNVLEYDGKFLLSPTSTPGGDKDMRPLNFL